MRGDYQLFVQRSAFQSKNRTGLFDLHGLTGLRPGLALMRASTRETAEADERQNRQRDEQQDFQKQITQP